MADTIFKDEREKEIFEDILNRINSPEQGATWLDRKDKLQSELSIEAQGHLEEIGSWFD